MHRRSNAGPPVPERKRTSGAAPVRYAASWRSGRRADDDRALQTAVFVKNGVRGGKRFAPRERGGRTNGITTRTEERNGRGGRDGLELCQSLGASDGRVKLAGHLGGALMSIRCVVDAPGRIERMSGRQKCPSTDVRGLFGAALGSCFRLVAVARAVEVPFVWTKSLEATSSSASTTLSAGGATTRVRNDYLVFEGNEGDGRRLPFRAHLIPPFLMDRACRSSSSTTTCETSATAITDDLARRRSSTGGFCSRRTDHDRKTRVREDARSDDCG